MQFWESQELCSKKNFKLKNVVTAQSLTEPHKHAKMYRQKTTI